MITVLYLRLSTEIRYNELITSNIDKNTKHSCWYGYQSHLMIDHVTLYPISQCSSVL